MVPYEHLFQIHSAPPNNLFINENGDMFEIAPNAGFFSFHFQSYSWDDFYDEA